jgi:hypothetical protein
VPRFRARAALCRASRVKIWTATYALIRAFVAEDAVRVMASRVKGIERDSVWVNARAAALERGWWWCSVRYRLTGALCVE